MKPVTKIWEYPAIRVETYVLLCKILFWIAFRHSCADQKYYQNWLELEAKDSLQEIRPDTREGANSIRSNDLQAQFQLHRSQAYSFRLP